MNTKDIEGCSPLKRGHVREEARIGTYKPMDYRDVTNVDFKSTRSVNPLCPTYMHRGDDDKKTVGIIGPIIGNIPVILPPARQDPNFLNKSLNTKDILGCGTSTKGLDNFHTRIRRDYKNTNNTQDIVGAQPNTLKKSPETTRRTHPLMPDYQMPGRFDILNQNDVYAKRETI